MNKSTIKKSNKQHTNSSKYIIPRYFGYSFTIAPVKKKKENILQSPS